MNILDKIVEEKRREVARLPAVRVSGARLREALRARGQSRDFAQALRQPQFDVALIAEVKKASPSAGLIRPDFDPVRIALEYEAGGASCLSVLTDEKFFQGSLDYLKQIRKSVRLPLLRKDFVLDERQILEAVEAGADAILLIVAILNDTELAHLHSLATDAGLTALVEVHDEVELERALAVDAKVLGVNNRNLKTFDVNLETTALVARKLSRSFPADHPARPVLVAESGIHSRADVERVAQCGAQAILVGESLMRSPDLGVKIAQLLGAPEEARKP